MRKADIRHSTRSSSGESQHQRSSSHQHVSGDPAQPEQVQGPLVAKGRLMHRTATMAFTEATVYDAEGHACTHATGTFKYVKRLPVGAGSANDMQPVSTD